MMRGRKKLLGWIGAATALLFVIVGVWAGLKYVESKVTYRNLAQAAGEAYGVYFLANGKWPDDLPEALRYAREHAKKESWLFGVTHDSNSMGYLENMEVSPGIDKELSTDLASWKGNGWYERVMEKHRLMPPLKVKSHTTADEGDRVGFTRNFYWGIAITLEEGEVGAESEPSGKP